MENREDTPPHHPTYGIHFSDDEIRSIIKVCINGPSTRYTISRLAHGKSFNNRIYFIDDDDYRQQSYVLKINGQFWGPAKVENEVSCLQILQRFCPEVPTPQVVAWSIDGNQIDRSNTTEWSSRSTSLTVPTKSKQGWILMTRLPGQPIDSFNLSVKDMSSLSKQLAHIVSSWRTGIPKSSLCGNLRFGSSDRISSTSPWNDPTTAYLSLEVQGILDVGLSDTERPLDSLLAFWKAKLNNAIDQLKTQNVYAANRESLLPLLTRFLAEVLPDLSICKNGRETKDGFVFSHTDLSPRNVLISGSPPQVTGIVDFEFSGFFPGMHEFTAKSLVSVGDDDEGWPVALYYQICQHLEGYGTETPLQLKTSKIWKETMELVKLENYIAPWWLPADEIDPAELDRELKEARIKVEAALIALKHKP